jgi:hypothetical protein
MLVCPSGSATTALEAHRRRQDDFRRQFGTDYRKDLDLVFANPDGTPLKLDSISASVSADGWLAPRFCVREKLDGGYVVWRHHARATDYE